MAPLLLLLRLPAALLALAVAANSAAAAAQQPVQVTFFSERNFEGIGIALNSTDNCVALPDELRTKVSSFHLDTNETDVRLWKGELCTGDSKVWPAGGNRLVGDIGKSMAKSAKSFSTCSTSRMALCRDMRGFINGACAAYEMYNLSYIWQFNRFLYRTVYIAAARLAALTIENSMCELCLGRESSSSLNRRSEYECPSPKAELAISSSGGGLPPSKATAHGNLFITRTMTVVWMLVQHVRERPVGKRELRALYLVIVGRPPQSPHEEKILEGWVRISDDLDKNKNGLIEADEVEGLELDLSAADAAAPEGVHGDDDFVDLD